MRTSRSRRTLLSSTRQNWWVRGAVAQREKGYRLAVKSILENRGKPPGRPATAYPGGGGADNEVGVGSNLVQGYSAR